MDADPIETVTVDSYTTLVDVGAAEDALDARGVDDPAAVSALWRSTSMGYTMIANDIDAYRPFYDLLGLALRYALEAHGHDLPGPERDAIRREVYRERLAVFEDVRPGLERIARAGYDVYVLSNGDPDMLDRLVEAAGIGDVVSGTISAAEVRRYKPEPAIYRHAAARIGTPIRSILHASAGGMRDVWGAKYAGMAAAWIRRPDTGSPREFLGPEPDVEVEGFLDLADRLAGRS